MMRAALAFAGRHGPVLLIGGISTGLLLPRVAAFVHPAFAATVFVFTLGAFLKVDLGGFVAEAVQGWRNLGILGWTTFGVPMATLGLVHIAGFNPDLGGGVFLWSLAPPSGAAAALAAMLGLSAPLALLATLAATVAAPFYMPAMASLLGGYRLAVDPIAMGLRLLMIVGGSCVLSLAIKRLAPRSVRENPDSVTGIAVVALFVNGIAAMHGMQHRLLADPMSTLGILLLAYAINAGYLAAATLLFRWTTGQHAAATIGLCSGNRNTSLVWAAVGQGVLPVGEMYFAASIIAIHTMPAITRRMLAWYVQAGGQIPVPQIAPAPAKEFAGDRRRALTVINL